MKSNQIKPHYQIKPNYQIKPHYQIKPQCSIPNASIALISRSPETWIMCMYVLYMYVLYMYVHARTMYIWFREYVWVDILQMYVVVRTTHEQHFTNSTSLTHNLHQSISIHIIEEIRKIMKINTSILLNIMTWKIQNKILQKKTVIGKNRKIGCKN